MRQPTPMQQPNHLRLIAVLLRQSCKLSRPDASTSPQDVRDDDVGAAVEQRGSRLFGGSNCVEAPSLLPVRREQSSTHKKVEMVSHRPASKLEMLLDCRSRRPSAEPLTHGCNDSFLNLRELKNPALNAELRVERSFLRCQ